MSARSARVVPFGDRALVVELGGGGDPDVDRLAHAVAAAIRADVDGGWGCPVPAYDTVLVTFDPLLTTAEAAVTRLEALARGSPTADPLTDREIAPLEIPVRYGGADGPDLDEVAKRLGLRPAEVVDTHAAGRYRAYFLGFAPGFAYLGPLPEALAVPRQPRPRFPSTSTSSSLRSCASFAPAYFIIAAALLGPAFDRASSAARRTVCWKARLSIRCSVIRRRRS